MENAKTSVFSNILIWFGAAICISEMATGFLIAPLGFEKGILSIVIGHFIGCTLLYLAGLIGANTGKSAMDSVKISFGKKGSLLFSSLNILQLVGWTAIMIVGGAIAANSIVNIKYWIWCLVIGVLIIIWILIGIKNLGKVNVLAVGMLFVLTLILGYNIFTNHSTLQPTYEPISFGSAVELSVAMPLSWLPLISDYTRSAKSPKITTFASSLSYFFASCFMYTIGLGFALLVAQSDISIISEKFGIIALLIIIFSTVTTTFLDAYSAGVSSESINKNINGKFFSIIVTILGVFLAIFVSTSGFESFLYLIGSVFAPMIAILITDYFILKYDSSEENINYTNVIIWIIGFILYRIFMNIETPLGYTLPVMIITSFISVIINKILINKR